MPTEGSFTPGDFMAVDEVFLTGTGAGVVPVSRIDHQVVGAGRIGPVTRLLRERYESWLPSWCTPIDAPEGASACPEGDTLRETAAA